MCMLALRDSVRTVRTACAQKYLKQQKKIWAGSVQCTHQFPGTYKTRLLGPIHEECKTIDVRVQTNVLQLQ